MLRIPQISKTYKIKQSLKITFFSFALFNLVGCGFSESQNLRNIVPDEIKIEKELVSASSGSFDESQGFAIYQLSEETVVKIESKGISFFDDITQGRTNKWPLQDWQVTQSSVDFEWIKSRRIHHLVDLPKWTDEDVYSLYKAKTSFGGGIVIVPEAGLVNVYFTQ